MTSRCRLPLYAVLHVDRDADAEAIRDAYRETAKEYHPDVFDHEDAKDLFVWATRVVEFLTDETDRQRYNRVGHARFAEGEGWTSSACPASRAAAVYWPREEPSDGGSRGRKSPRYRTGTSGRDPGPTDATWNADTGSGGTGDTADSTAEGTSTESTRGTAQSTSGSTRAAGFDNATKRRRSRAAEGAAEWSHGAFTTREGTGAHHPGEELYFRNIGHVDTGWDADSGLKSNIALLFGFGFTLVVLFGMLALILYAL